MTTTISRLYDDYPTAVQVVKDLQNAGIPDKDISIVSNNAQAWPRARDDRDIRRPLVKDPDRFEAAHMRHEHVDQHDVEIAGLECAHSRFTTVGNGDLETLARQTDLDGNAYRRVVIDHENARHDDSFFLGRRLGDSHIPCDD